MSHRKQAEELLEQMGFETDWMNPEDFEPLIVVLRERDELRHRPLDEALRRLELLGSPSETVSMASCVELRSEETKCECHERDSSYVCEYCYSQGHRGHMQS